MPRSSGIPNSSDVPRCAQCRCSTPTRPPRSRNTTRSSPRMSGSQRRRRELARERDGLPEAAQILAARRARDRPRSARDQAGERRGGGSRRTDRPSVSRRALGLASRHFFLSADVRTESSRRRSPNARAAPWQDQEAAREGVAERSLRATTSGRGDGIRRGRPTGTGTSRHPAVLIVTTHASRNIVARRRSTFGSMISILLNWLVLFGPYPAAGGGGGGEPAGGTSGAAGTAGGGAPRCRSEPAPRPSSKEP